LCISTSSTSSTGVPYMPSTDTITIPSKDLIAWNTCTYHTVNGFKNKSCFKPCLVKYVSIIVCGVVWLYLSSFFFFSCNFACILINNKKDILNVYDKSGLSDILLLFTDSVDTIVCFCLKCFFWHHVIWCKLKYNIVADWLFNELNLLRQISNEK
jgi:hypothetical protein